MDILLLANDEEFAPVIAVMRQLRPQYSVDALTQQIKKQQQAGYQVVYAKSERGVLGVAGFVIGEKLAWGKHIYVDDLVTNESFRSSGVGTALLNWLKQFALQHGCEQLHLDSGVQRFAAHKFYLREGFVIASHHFSMTDINTP